MCALTRGGDACTFVLNRRRKWKFRVNPHDRVEEVAGRYPQTRYVLQTETGGHR